jgi:hypothetical protein
LDAVAILATGLGKIPETFGRHCTPISPVGKISSRDVENVRRYYAEVQGVLISTPSLPDVNESEEEDEG